MGSFWTAVHIRTTDEAAVDEAARRLGLLPAYVLGQKDGWVSLYPSATEDQDVETVESVVAELSGAIGAYAFAVLVHDSDVLMYVLAEKGQIKDAYNSMPGYFSGEEAHPSGGDVKLLLPLCRDGMTAMELSAYLHEGKRPPVDLPPGLSLPDTAGLMEKMRAEGEKRAAEMKKMGYSDAMAEKMIEMMRQSASMMPGLVNEMASGPDGDGLAAFLEGALGLEEGTNMVGFRYIERGEGPEGARLLEKGS